MTAPADFELLCRDLDNDLSPAEQNAFSARLEADPALAADCALLRDLQATTGQLLDVRAPDTLSTNIMAKVRVQAQVSAHPVRRMVDWLREHWAVPVAAAAACSLMLAVGLPDYREGAALTRADQSVNSAATPTEQFAEVEIEEVDSEADYNVLVLSAPGSRNRVVWLTPRANAEEEG